MTDLQRCGHEEGSGHLKPGVTGVICRLWQDQGVKECFARWAPPGATREPLVTRRSQLQIPDSVGFFLDNIARVTAEDYSPTDEDILLSRKQTTGVVEHTFNIHQVNMAETTTLPHCHHHYFSTLATFQIC